MRREESSRCPKCDGPAVLTKTLVEYERGTVTSFEWRCESPECGEETRSAVDGNQMR